MPARIGRLHLRVSVDDRDRAAASAIRRDVERDHAPRVIRAIARALEQRYGAAAIVRVRSLSARWEVARDRLAASDASESFADGIGRELAADIAAALDAQPSAPCPREDAGLVLFRDRAHARAVSLRFGDDRPWFDREGAPAQVWEAACDDGADAVAALLGWLDAIGASREAVAAAPHEALARAVAAVPLAAWPGLAAEVARTRGVRESDASADGADGGQTGGLTSLRTAAADGETTRASAASRPAAHDGAVAAPDRRVRTADRKGAPGDAATGLEHGGSESRELGAVSSRGGRAVVDASGAAPVPTPSRRALDRVAGSGRPIPEPAASEREPTAGGEREPTGSERAEAAGERVFTTEFAGLFYLVGRVLELDMAEHLWCAGLREGHVLCHVARLLAASAGGDDRARALADRDPAPRLLGGVEPRARDPELADVADWAAREVMDKALASLAARVRSQPSGSRTDELAAAVDRLAARLTGHTAPRSAGGAARARAAQRMVARLAAALLQLVAVRLGIEVAAAPDAAGAVCARVFMVAGQVAIEPDAVRVRMPMSAIDIDVRRAGLDANPGHAPWLDRVVQIEFEEPEARADAADRR